MKAIKEISKKIETAKLLRSDAQAELERAQKFMTGSGISELEAKLSEFHVQRKEILANAFINKIAPDTSKIDASIQAANSSLEQAKSESEAAAAAIPFLESKLGQTESDLTALNGQMKNAIDAYCSSEFESVRAEYQLIIGSIESVLGRMNAIATVHGQVCQNGYFGQWTAALFQRLMNDSLVDESQNAPWWLSRHAAAATEAALNEFKKQLRDAGAPV